MSVPRKPYGYSCSGESFGIIHHFAVNQARLDEECGVIYLLLLCIVRQVGFRLLSLKLHQEKPDQLHVPFHGDYYVPPPI